MQGVACSFYNNKRVESMTVQDLISNKNKNVLEQRKSSINIDPKDYSEDALKVYAMNLQFHLNESNLERTEIDRLNAEALIEKDFSEMGYI